MKLFTCRTEIHLVSAAGMYPHASVVHERYPSAKPGIELNADRELIIGWEKQIKASKALLELPADSKAIVRDRHKVTILRASVEVGAGGQIELVPEKDGDADQALVLFDVGRGPAYHLDLQTDSENIVAEVKLATGGWGLGREHHMLARLRPFQSVRAVRTDKKWIFWGAEYVKEVLDFKFDGQTVFFDVTRNKRPR